MVVLRWATSDDVEQIARVQTRCFPGPDIDERIARIRNDARCQISDILTAEIEGRIVGSATLIPQRVWTGGAEHPQGGVAAVQVDPDYRRRGIAQALMRRILEAHRERGYALSMLHPYNPLFYRRLGYAPVERWIELRLRTASLPESDAATAVRTAEAGDFDRIVECHRRSLAQHNGGLSRTRAVWEQRIIDPRRTIAVFEREGRVEGYVIYELLPTSDALQQILQVREWVALGDEAARAIFGYLAMQKAQCPETRLFAPVDFPLMLFLFEPRSPVYENPANGRYTSGSIGTSAMARTVSLARLFSCGRRFTGPPMKCLFRVLEAVRNTAGNERSGVEEVGVEFDGTRAQVTSEKPAYWFECDAGTMAQVYFGAVRPSDAARWGAARADSTDTLDKLDILFSQRAPFIHPLDFF